MQEELLHIMWQQQLFDCTTLRTTTGESVVVEKIGMKNPNAGPDFLDAHIRIDSTLWVGNVEIHTKSSLWTAHKHHTQESYNSVILHVVAEYDKDALTARGTKLPTLVLPVNKNLLTASETLLASTRSIMCFKELPRIDTFLQNMVFDRLVVERFERKAVHVLALLAQNAGAWEETCYQMVARSLGAPVNSTAFEELAHALPLRILAKHGNSLMQLEALLFGQAGLLSEEIENSYYKTLQNEYAFLQKKYQLTPLAPSLWKFSRMRPSSFPTMRMAQLAQLVFQSQGLTAKILHCETIAELEELFTLHLHEFWNTHYTFATTHALRKKSLGENTVHNIIINTVVPFLFAYGSYHSRDDIKQRALDFLETLPPEHNSIISEWEKCGIQCKSAFRSQALLQLHNEYCTRRKCLQCNFGKRIIAQYAKPMCKQALTE
ncbi:MAG: DUF2851 family protein [Bacteroidales bacterium]|jgi:hypothetical protein|nr:DUF2851 family protein [Bacteroidales bacterium]